MSHEVRWDTTGIAMGLRNHVGYREPGLGAVLFISGLGNGPSDVLNKQL